MRPFTGFDNDDFDFFIMFDSDYEPILKEKLEAFSKQLFRRLPLSIRKAYPDLHPGKINKADPSSAWFGIRKAQDDGDIFRHCNFSIELDKEGLEFDAVIREGRYLDRKPIGYFYRRV